MKQSSCPELLESASSLTSILPASFKFKSVSGLDAPIPTLELLLSSVIGATKFSIVIFLVFYNKVKYQFPVEYFLVLLHQTQVIFLLSYLLRCF